MTQAQDKMWGCTKLRTRGGLNIFPTSKPQKNDASKYFQRMTNLQSKMRGGVKTGITQWLVEQFCYKQTNRKMMFQSISRGWQGCKAKCGVVQKPEYNSGELDIFATSKLTKKDVSKYFQRMTKLQDKMWDYTKIEINQWWVEHFCYKQTKKKYVPKYFRRMTKLQDKMWKSTNRNKTLVGWTFLLRAN